MKIGINLDDYESPMEDIANIINVYGMDTEICYLKLSPRRFPVIMSEKKAMEKIDGYGNHEMHFCINGEYEMIVDDRTVFSDEKDLWIDGETFIGKRQGKKHTALTFREMVKLMAYAFDIERGITPEKPILVTGLSAYEFDEDRGYWV